MFIIWVATPCTLLGCYLLLEEIKMIFFRAEDADSMFLRKADNYPGVYTASRPRTSSSSQP
jgi:hypothetical protein